MCVIRFFLCGVVIVLCGSLSALSAAEATPQIGSLVMKVDVQPAVKVANDRFFETALDVSLINQSPGSIRLDKAPLRVNVLFSTPAPSVPDQFGPPMSYAMNPSADPKDNIVFLQSGEMIGKRFPILLAGGATAHITVLFDAKQGIVKVAGNRNYERGLVKCMIIGHIENQNFVIEKQEYTTEQVR